MHETTDLRRTAVGAQLNLGTLAGHPMLRKFTEAEVREHNRFYQKGWGLVRGELLLSDGSAWAPPTWLARRRLKRAIACFERALAINPDGWQSMWALGKVYQRIGAPDRALGHLARAHAINPSHPDVAREAGLVAIDTGDGPAAVKFSRAAVAAQPENAGLHSNLALALLINGENDSALQAIGEALKLAPSDRTATNVKIIAEDVIAGRRHQPRNGRDLR